MSIYSIGVGALNNAQVGVATTGHNIANASTPGYSRQIVDLQSNQPHFTGSGFIGTGASVSAIQRMYDGFLGAQLRQTNSDATGLSTYLAQMRQIDNLLGDPTAGLSPAMNGFFQSVQAVSAQPSDISARQAMISSAQALTSQFRSMDAQLQALRAGTNGSIQSSVARINSLTQQIATLNDRIARLSGAGTNSQQPNDLLDQRDALVTDLNQEIGANVVQAADGSYNVFLSSGQAVVLGTNAATLKAGADSGDPTDVQVSISVGAGQMRLNPNDLSGGKLGGYMSFRQQGLTDAQNALGRIAMAVASSVNSQQQLGQDLSGNPGGNLFTSGAPAVIANASNNKTVNAALSVQVADMTAVQASDYNLSYDGTNYTLTRLADNATVYSGATLPATPQDGLAISLASVNPPATSMAAGDRFLIQPVRAGAQDFDVALSDVRLIAAAAPIQTAGGPANAGTGSVDAGSVNAPPPPNANLRQPVTITFTSPTTFDVAGAGTANPSGVAYTPGAAIVYNGWTIHIGGQPAAGDTFSVSANSNGSGDNRNAQLIAALQTRNLVGGTNFNGAYGQLVSQVGNKTSELQVTSAAQANLAASVQTAQNSVSGVNLDEEAANLIRYQQAYQAAGKLINVANTLFDTILNLKS